MTTCPPVVSVKWTGVRQFLTGNGVFAFFDSPWVPIYVAVLFLLHPWLGVLALVFAVVQGCIAWFGHGLSKEAQRVANGAQAQTQAQQQLLQTPARPHVQTAPPQSAADAHAGVPPARSPDPAADAMELRQLYIYKPWHGLGIADVLTEWAKNTARSRGAPEIWLSVFTENPRARMMSEAQALFLESLMSCLTSPNLA